MISIGDILGARKFVTFMRENTTGYTEEYQKFLELTCEVAEKMLEKWEQSAQETGDDMEVGV